MTKILTLDTAKAYATEKALATGLARMGLADHPCRRIICRTPDGKWTAVFLVTEHLNANGGYIGFAARHGFLSV